MDGELHGGGSHARRKKIRRISSRRLLYRRRVVVRKNDKGYNKQQWNYPMEPLVVVTVAAEDYLGIVEFLRAQGTEGVFYGDKSICIPEAEAVAIVQIEKRFSVQVSWPCSIHTHVTFDC